MATKRALSSDQDNTKPNKKLKTEGRTETRSKQYSPPPVERRHPSWTVKKPISEGPLTRIEARSNGSEAARTASTLTSRSSSVRLSFPRSNDQELTGLKRSPTLKAKGITRCYQDNYPFEFNTRPFEVTPPDPTPKVQTTSAYPDGPSNSNELTMNDAKCDHVGMHDWYKAVAGDEEAFDRLFSSIVFVDEPLE